MEDVYGHFSYRRTLSLICCVFWIFSPADGSTMSAAVGTTVTLHCNMSNGTLMQQLTWRKDRKKVSLISYKPETPLFTSAEARSLKINMSLSEKCLYALVIDSVQKNHTGNYTCEIALFTGAWEQNWELIIKSPNGENNQSGYRNQILIPVATAVPISCFLIFTLSFILVQRIYSRHSEQSRQPPTTGMWQEETEEHIYENSLEVSHPSSYHYKPRGQ